MWWLIQGGKFNLVGYILEEKTEITKLSNLRTKQPKDI